MKKIIFCADGTWNHPGETQDNLPADTNVYKFYKALLISATQLPRYDDGVGADGTPIDQLLGGAIGDGLFKKIQDGYSFICHSFDDGDQIFLFGFSRGAYTARSLAGMIAVCGVPSPDKFSDQAVKDAFVAYRDIANRNARLGNLAQQYGNRPVNIATVGVWDTVGALGIPGDVFKDLDTGFYGFLDTALHENVKAAYHAVSIDERRPEFAPTLWQDLSAAAKAAGNVLEQVWFSGVHGDVGGGYAEAGLSSIALKWMMMKAKDSNLEFDTDAFDQYTSVDRKHALDVQHESWSPLWGFPKMRTVSAGSTISSSVVLRLASMVQYRPTNLAYTSAGTLADYNVEPVV